jgi:hypothetical protein
VSISMRPAAFERLGEVRRQKLKLGMVVATIGGIRIIPNVQGSVDL